MSERLTPDEREFLSRISRGEKPGLADRKADRARQHCRRNGLAEWSRGSWHITQEGRAALSREEGR